MSSSLLQYRKSQDIIKVSGIQPLGTMNVCTTLIHPVVVRIFQSEPQMWLNQHLHPEINALLKTINIFISIHYQLWWCSKCCQMNRHRTHIYRERSDHDNIYIHSMLTFHGLMQLTNKFFLCAVNNSPNIQICNHPLQRIKGELSHICGTLHQTI